MNFIINSSVAKTTAIFAISAIVASLLPMTTVSAQAAPSCTIVSNSDTQVDGDDSAIISDSNLPGSAWASISGANWIWTADTANAPAGTKTFTRSFIVNGTSTNATLKLLADNGYIVSINGTEIDDKSAVENNFGSVNQYDITTSLIPNSQNSITVVVTNLPGSGDNPAGLNYKIEMTGNTCNPLPVDVCENIGGLQEEVPVDYEEEGGICTLVSTIVSVGEDVAKCVDRTNLLTNGSFENPEIGGQWGAFEVPSWISSAAGNVIELWRNFNGNGAGTVADGAQLVELDGTEPTTISQDVTTVANNEYLVSFQFSPRLGTNLANNKVELFVDGLSQGTVANDGTGNTDNDWSTHTYTFIASDATSTISFKDLGTADKVGTLLDDVSVCLVEDNSTPVEPDTYEIFGYVWDDTDEDDVREEGEANLEGWTVRATEVVDEGEADVITDVTDASGRYSLYVPAGTWVVEQLTEEGWTLLSIGNNGDGTYVVVVPVPEEVSELSFLNWLIPTAHAAAFDAEAGQFNFGNDQDEERRGGGSSSGTRVGDRNPRTPTGEVLGSSTSTPTGVVLGDATTTMPVGAPNTGAGGTSPVSVSLPTLVAILGTSARKSK